jgi:hypothetical protein
MDITYNILKWIQGRVLQEFQAQRRYFSSQQIFESPFKIGSSVNFTFCFSGEVDFREKCFQKPSMSCAATKDSTSAIMSIWQSVCGSNLSTTTKDTASVIVRIWHTTTKDYASVIVKISHTTTKDTASVIVRIWHTTTKETASAIVRI